MSTMIQNPNEIEAFTRRQRALARIHRNIAEKFQLNRRQFISGSLATMALAALGLSGCAPKTPAASTGDAAPAFTPGTYEATAQGRNGEIKVSVTFEADRIASIEADHMESRNIGDAAVRLLTDNYLDTQKLLRRYRDRRHPHLHGLRHGRGRVRRGRGRRHARHHEGRRLRERCRAHNR